MPVTLSRISQGNIFDAFDDDNSTPFIMPTYCIVRDCALHSLDQQQTFHSEGDRAHHLNKFHRDILCCLVDSDDDLKDTDNHYLDFLGLVACPVYGCNYLCFSDGLAH